MIKEINFYDIWVKYQKIIKLVALGIVGLIIFIVIISRPSANSYKGIENTLVTNAKKYVNNNDIHIDNSLYLTNDKLNVNYGDKKCSDASGVLVENKNNTFQYTPYLICDDYTSEVVSKTISSTNTKFLLKGDNPLIIMESQSFDDPGYTNNTNYNVVVDNEVVNDTPGLYYINYKLSENNTVKQTIKRMVVVLSLGDDNSTTILYNDGLKLKLNGEQEISLEQGQAYEELGSVAIDNHDGDISSKIKVYGSVDTNKIGDYNLTYEVTNSAGNIIKLIRTVSVIAPSVDMDIESTLSTTALTNSDVTITIKINNKQNYYRTLLPNLGYSYSSNVNYKVSNNGSYTFKVYDKYGNYREQTVNVDNINRIPPIGLCVIKYDGSKTNVIVSATDSNDISGYSYSDGQTSSNYITSNKYTFNNLLKTVYVRIKDMAGNIKDISCTAKLPQKDLEVHMFMMGDGDAIVIRSTSYVIVVDGGYSDNRGANFVKYMKGLGITKIDAYIATHYDGDHIGAVPQIFKNFPVVDSYLQTTPPSKGGNEYLDPLRNRSKVVKPDDVIKFGDEMEIKIVGPIAITSDCKKKGYFCQNSDSINFILKYGNNKFFFAGDYVQSSAIIKRYGKAALSNIDFLKQPHHGLHDYISKNLLEIMKPKYVFVPDGRDHMSDTMKGWLSGVGAQVYHTCARASQTLVATSDGNKITIHRDVKASDFKR